MSAVLTDCGTVEAPLGTWLVRFRGRMITALFYQDRDLAESGGFAVLPTPNGDYAIVATGAGIEPIMPIIPAQVTGALVDARSAVVSVAKRLQTHRNTPQRVAEILYELYGALDRLAEAEAG